MKRKSYYPKTVEFLVALKDICNYICRNIYHDPEILLNFVLKKIVKLMNAKAGNIRIFDKVTKKLILKASYGVSKKYRNAKLALPIGKSIAGLVFQNEKVYVVEDLRLNNKYIFPEYALKEGIISLISAPLITSDRKLGVFSIYFPEVRKFTKEEIEFFTTLSDFLATFLTTHTLHYQLRRSYLDMAKALIIALEEKDIYTKGHSERVKEYALKIAEKLKLSKNMMQVLSDLSILHDIGKVIIDTTILNKPGRLTEEEWKIIKQHPIVGAKMLSPVNGLTSGIPLIKHHHERIDGKGYPNGLSGNSIPLIAKIVAVADAFDAMTSPRSYRPAMSVEKAKKELIKNAGKQFDEKIVKIMIDLIDEGKITNVK